MDTHANARLLGLLNGDEEGRRRALDAVADFVGLALFEEHPLPRRLAYAHHRMPRLALDTSDGSLCHAFGVPVFKADVEGDEDVRLTLRRRIRELTDTP